MPEPTIVNYIESLVRSGIRHIDTGRNREGAALLKTAARLGQKHLSQGEKTRLLQKIILFDTEPSEN